MEPHSKENDQEAVEESGRKSSPGIGEKLKELFDCPASLVFGRQRTAEGGKGPDVRSAGRVHPGEAATEQKQGEVDGKRSAIS
jgi:hypothetical protein